MKRIENSVNMPIIFCFSLNFSRTERPLDKAVEDFPVEDGPGKPQGLQANEHRHPNWPHLHQGPSLLSVAPGGRETGRQAGM